MKFGVVALVAICSLSACSKSTPQPGNEPSQPPAATPAAPSASPDSVESALGFKPELATDRAVSELRADFNGDGAEDRLLVVKSSSMPGEAPANIRVVRPWPLEKDESAGGLSHGASVNLVIVDGKSAAAPRAVVLHDDNSVSLLDAPAAAELKVIKRTDLGALDEPAFVQAARGDVLAVPTEAGIDTYIYWDGSTYKLYAPADAP
jgi:hypothetical protein